MEWYDIEVDGQHTVKFADLPYVPLTSPPQSPGGEEIIVGQKLGGIIRHGEWSWLARNSMLQIVSLRNGQTISTYEFCDSRGYESCYIKCVEEIFPNNPEIMLLAVILESFRGPGGGCTYVALYSVELGSVLCSIELSLHVTCARFMDASACRRTLLQNFDGCLAVGSEEGVIVLLDLNIRKILPVHSEMQDDVFVPCHIVDYNLPLTEIHRNFRQCQQDGIHFGLQMEVIESPCSIQCILPIDLILGLAIGLEDGRLALYDLAELQIFYIAIPQREVTMSALVKMDFLEPPDDPRPCLYIWTLHENGENLHAVLHSLMYEKRLIEEDTSNSYFETFQTSSVRLQLPLEATKSVALACQAISTLSSHGEDDSNCLCAISWYSVLEVKNKLLIFDLNQWYKEEMPFVLEYGKQPNYLAGYILNGECTGLHTLLNPDTIAHFNSMQRFEEHFYPNSLSFDCSLLHTDGCRRYNWEGSQNRVINLLRSSNAAIFLDPNVYFNEIIRTRLMPQFIELNLNSTFSRSSKYDILLSTALEHNCVSLLRDCAKSWIDGSFMGNFAVSTGLSLSTLTDWIWKRATDIKTRCNDLCKSLFEFGGYPLDNREQKELGFITRQLKLLSDLLGEILIYAKKQIPERVYSSLQNKHTSLCMASSYQDILLWLLNIGLLPEASPHNDKINVSNELVPYPYKQLKELYKKKRSYFAKINDTFVSKKSGSCRLLYIDAFIDHACKGNVLHEYWLENDGDGLYPPNSIEAMLRIMLVPDLEYDNKCAILLYFFLDLNMAIDEEAYKEVVANFIKFPSVFKLSASLIKTVQAFWNLDHEHFLPAVDEFISPFNKNQNYPQWLVELLIEALLTQNASNLALRILESQPSLISPMLKLKTLLANELISEAFHFVRSKNDDSLLEVFFTCCLCNGQFGVIRDLALSEREGSILQTILKRSKAPGAESLHFVYLLQKSKYIEAVSYMDELSNKTKGTRSSLQQSNQMDTPNLVLSAFNTTMTPVTQGLTDVYFRIKNKIKKKEVDNKSPVPLSCQLIKQNANSLLGGIYHSSALSAHFATYYWGEMDEQKQNGAKHLLSSNNAPFLRRPQIETNYMDYVAKNNLSYPQAYKVTEKRTLAESELLEAEDLERQKIENQQNPKKKRRLIGQEIVDDLSHFMKINTNSNNLNATDFKFAPEDPQKDIQDSNKKSLELLTRPLLTKPPRSSQDIEDVITIMPEIQGILKTNTPEPRHMQRDVAVEEEKNLRFRLPSTDVSNSQIQIEITQSEDNDEQMDIAHDEDNRPCSSLSYRETTKLKQITRSVSEESNKSSISSSNPSEDNFYSPLSSQNNSKLDCSNLSKYSFMSGPQPRKPLARLSSERSEKSLTPEPETRATILTDASKESSNLGYVTALDSLRKTTTSSRKPLERLSTERLEKSATSEPLNTSKESSNLAYVTAFSTINKPLTSSSLNTKTEVTQSSSCFVSISSHGTFPGSKINEFLPKISSSKVGTTPVKTCSETNNKPASPAKLSECTTVLGSLTTFECTNTGSNNLFAMPSMPKATKHTEEQKRQMLETTLGMTTYDFSILDSTSLQQTKSSLMVTAKDTSFKLETSQESEIENSLAEENEEKKEQMEGIEVESEYKEVLVGAEKEARKPDFKEDSNDDCIVLLSSSSSSADEDEYENQYSDNEEEADEEEEEGEEVEDDDEGEDVEDDDGEDVEYEVGDVEDEAEVQDDGEEEEYVEDEEEDNYMVNSEIGESNDSYISNVEDIEDEQSLDETDNESGTENEKVVQFIEDSSSDVRQPTSHYEESDSEDVKVVEDEQSLASYNTEKVDDVDEQSLASTNTEKVENDIPLFNSEEHKDKEAVSTTTSELKPSNINKDIEVKITAAQTETISVLPTTSSEIDIQINENENTSTTEIIQEKDASSRKSASKEEAENMDMSMKSCEDEEGEKKITETQEILQEQENIDDMSNQKVEVEKKAETKQDLEKDPTTTIETSTEEENMDMSMKSCEDEERENNIITEKPEISQEKENKDIHSNQKAEVEKTAKTENNLEKDPTTTKDVSKEEENMDMSVKSCEDEEVEKILADIPEISQEPQNIYDPSNKKVEVEKKEKDLKKDSENQTVEIETSKIQEAEKDSKEYIEPQEPEMKELAKDTNPNKLDSNDADETVNNLETTDEEPITLIMEDSIDCSDVKLQNPPENIEQESTVNEVKSKPNKDEKAENIENAVEMSKTNEKLKLIEKYQELENADVSTPRTRRTLRGSSVPPIELEPSVSTVASPRRNTRGISVPPQTLTESEEFSTLTPRNRRSLRASSLQPKNKLEEETDSATPRKREKLQESENPETSSRATRGSSVPPGGVAAKISTRRRSTVLDAINEDPTSLDSPSTRTRFRSRINSMDSELDSSIVGSDLHTQSKRSRKTSISSSVSELPQTPKRTRRNSISSQPETIATLTPRTLRARSVLSVQEEEETDSISPSPKPLGGNKRIGTKRKKSTDEPTTENNEQTEDHNDERQQSPKSDHSTTSGVSYSTTRRLTRTQLAMMEKSTALTQSTTHEAVTNEVTLSPPTNKRKTKTRATRSSSNAHQDSDDAESVSSKHSNVSSATASRRRVTRTSIKEKDEMDDDAASVASSVGSDKHQKPRRSKDKTSPTTTLTAIPEDAPVETKKRGRPTKH